MNDRNPVPCLFALLSVLLGALPAAAEALEEALRRAAGEAVVLVTGSLFVAASARIAWQERPVPYRWLAVPSV